MQHFSVPNFLAHLNHLSRRLIVRLRPHSLNISETTGPVKVKFHMELLWDGGRKFCSYGPGHIFSGTKRPMTLKLGMQHQVLEYYQVCSNDDPGLTIIYSTARSNLVPYTFVWGEKINTDFFQKLLWSMISK